MDSLNLFLNFMAKLVSEFSTLTIFLAFGSSVVTCYPVIIIIWSLLICVVLGMLYGAAKLVAVRQEHRRQGVTSDFLFVGVMLLTLSMMGLKALRLSFESEVTGFEGWMVVHVVICCAYFASAVGYAFRMADFVRSTLSCVNNYSYHRPGFV